MMEKIKGSSYFFMAFSILLIFQSCGEQKQNTPQKSGKISQAQTKVKIPVFNADSAYTFVQKQVDFGKRYMNTQEHEDCVNWLSQKLKSYDLEVIEQTFEAKAYTGEMLKGTNIIARHNPDVAERMILAAHFDTRHIADKDEENQEAPIDGADDGGSGVGVLIEIARLLKANPIPMGIDIILFDAEDYGADEAGQDYSWGLGSQYWSKNLHEPNYQVKYGILLDMVGSKDARFPKEGFSIKTAKAEVDKIWKLGQKMGYAEYFEDRYVGYYTDDHRFVIENTNIPMLDIVNIKKDGKFGDYHHTHDDNMELISKKTLGAVGQVVLATIVKESNGDPF